VTDQPNSALDGEMEAVLRALAMCCHVPAVNPQGGTAGSDEHPGGGRPPGDLGSEEYARRYGPPFHQCTPKCDHRGPVRSDEGRRALLAEAKAELQSIRGYGLAAVPRPAGETADEFDERIVKKGEGWTAKEAAAAFKTTPTRVIRARKAADRETEYGRPPEPPTSADRRRTRVLELKGRGRTIAQIVATLGVSRSTVERDLGQRDRREAA
jgi:hypothetical protein